MTFKNNFLVLIIAGSVISLATFSFAKLTAHLTNGSPFEFNITQVDVLNILWQGIAFAIFMMTVKINSTEN